MHHPGAKHPTLRNKNQYQAVQWSRELRSTIGFLYKTPYQMTSHQSLVFYCLTRVTKFCTAAENKKIMSQIRHVARGETFRWRMRALPTMKSHQNKMCWHIQFYSFQVLQEFDIIYTAYIHTIYNIFIYSYTIMYI